MVEGNKMVDKSSKMYQAGYDFTIQVTYIPDFKSPQEKIDFEGGSKDGYKARDSGQRRPIY